MRLIKNLAKIVILLFISLQVNAQLVISGIVTNAGSKGDSLNNKPLSFVAVENYRTNGLQRTNKEGKFNINARLGDTISFYRLGYFTYNYIVQTNQDETISVSLLPKKNVIDEVNVTRTKYEKDSLERASIVQKGLEYKQTTGLINPVTSLYQQFSKKYKNLRKFQAQYKETEKQRYVDTKYTYEIVNELTKLEGDDAAYFMNAYPMEYKFARTSDVIEIKMWVINNFKSWQKIKLDATKKFLADSIKAN